jgi:hypothetical protein
MHTSHLTRIFSVLAGAALYLSFFPASARAQDPNVKKPGTSASADRDSEEPRHLLPKSITLSGQIRERWESTKGPSFVPTTAESYVLSRIRFGVAFKPTSWLRFFGETQDSRATGAKGTWKRVRWKGTA